MKFTIYDFEIIQKLGEGTYGLVYKALNKVTNEICAIKKFKREHCTNGVNCTTLREVALLKQLIHPNIISLQQTIINKGVIYMVLEYLSTDLGKYLLINGGLEFPLVKRFTYQIMQAMLFSHKNRILHRDLKPQNLLLDEKNLIIKVGDFGLARTYCPPVKQLTHEVVSLHYRAPEILLNTKRYSCPADVWSVGCIIGEMFTGNVLFYSTSEIAQIKAIFEIMGTPNEKTWPGVKELPGWQHVNLPSEYKLNLVFEDGIDKHGLDLLNQMLYYDPEARISFREALSHSYFDDLDKSAMPAKDEEKASPLIKAFNDIKMSEL